MRIAPGVASGGMAQAADTARAIRDALAQARSTGTAPAIIVLDDVTRESLRRAGLGYWSAGRATWSLFNVPVVTGLVSGWRLRFPSDPGAAANGHRPEPGPDP